LTSLEILTYLEQRSVRLRLAGNELEIDAPESALTPDLVERIRARKAELLDFLKSAIEQYDWRADCAQLFAEARAQVAINLANGACPDCGGGLLENKLSDERAQYCAACDFTWRAEDFAEIRATLARLNRQHERQAA
jgi:hypothetical protein